MFVPETVAAAPTVSVRATSPVAIVSVRPAVKTSALASVKSNAAPVDRRPKPVSAASVPPVMTGLPVVIMPPSVTENGLVVPT